MGKRSPLGSVAVWATTRDLLLPSHSVKTSCRVLNAAVSVLGDTAPNFFTSLALSTARIWSRRISPFLPPCATPMRNGALRLCVDIGATITVRRWSCISAGDTTTHGRVFLISLPMGFVPPCWRDYARAISLKAVSRQLRGRSGLRDQSELCTSDLPLGAGATTSAYRELLPEWSPSDVVRGLATRRAAATAEAQTGLCWRRVPTTSIVG